MISQTLNSWQKTLKESIRTPESLIHLLDLDPSLLPSIQKACKLFPLQIPSGFLARMEKGNPHDPLLKQVLPLDHETVLTPGFSIDPLQEKQANPIPGLLHKYHGRVLLTLTAACAVNCRYCFRRHFPYAQNLLGKTGFQKILAYLKKHTEITEVILSGGDPLLADDCYLEKIITQLETISHLKILRIHSRIPIVLPERITCALINLLKKTPLKTILIVHSNHPNELDKTVEYAIEKITKKNIPVLNQSVLLKGINDHPHTLAQLSHRLFEMNIFPYYLHLLDRTQGTAHFEVPVDTAKRIFTSLQNILPGYLVPRLAQEIAGAKSKDLIKKY